MAASLLPCCVLCIISLQVASANIDRYSQTDALTGQKEEDPGIFFLSRRRTGLGARVLGRNSIREETTEASEMVSLSRTVESVVLSPTKGVASRGEVKSPENGVARRGGRNRVRKIVKKKSDNTPQGHPDLEQHSLYRPDVSEPVEVSYCM